MRQKKPHPEQAHIRNAVLKSRSYKGEQTPENQAQLRRVAFCLCRLPDCQANQPVREYSSYEELQKLQVHLCGGNLDHEVSEYWTVEGAGSYDQERQKQAPNQIPDPRPEPVLAERRQSRPARHRADREN